MVLYVNTMRYEHVSSTQIMLAMKRIWEIRLFIYKAPMHWYSKRKNTVETGNIQWWILWNDKAFEMIKALRYQLRMFGVLIGGATNIYYGNEAVYKITSVPESVLKKKRHSIAYHRCREAVVAIIIHLVEQERRRIWLISLLR